MYHTDEMSMKALSQITAFDHAVMRGMRPRKPYLLMESTPSLVNWHPFNKLKRPGVHLLTSLQAIACGADSVQYFQWRKGRGSYEQYHGAVIDHLGTDDTRVFRDVAQVGEALARLAPVAGSTIRAEAAVLFNWSNRWAIDNMAGLSQSRKQYEDTCRRQYGCLTGLGLETDVVSPMADLSGYRLVSAPMLYLLHEGEAQRLEKYVREGGILVLTYLTGYVDQDTLNYLGGFPGDGMKDWTGLISEEIDTLYPSDSNTARFTDGTEAAIRDYCEVLRVKDAEVMAVYGADFYAGTPVVTRRSVGKGQVWYVAARLSDEGMTHVYALALPGTRYVPASPVEHHMRSAGDVCYDFYLNQGDAPVTTPIRHAGRDLLTDAIVGDTLTLAPYGVAVVVS